MNFKEKFNLISNVYDLTNAQLARIADIDPSIISRFRSGSRVPTKASKQLMKICNAIVIHSKEIDREKQLYEICSYPEKNTTYNLSEWLFRWLLSDFDSDVISSKSQKTAQKVTYKFFADKLNALMNLLDISNIRLANAVNVDSSLISRFRNRSRIPSGEATVRAICHYLYKRAVHSNALDELCNLMDSSNTIDKRDNNAVIESLYEWLTDDDKEENLQILDSFLENIDTFSLENISHLPPLQAVVPLDILNEDTTCYFGIDGLRRAVIRFLGSQAMEKEPGTLTLYSDQNLEWLTSDPTFARQWQALMVYTLKSKKRLKIIHNINRNLNELLESISKWLPLYMSGLIESYYFDRFSNSHFAHTMFIASNKAAIIASFVRGTEDSAQYHYITNEKVDYFEKQFSALAIQSKPFVRMFMPGDSKGLLFLQKEMLSVQGETRKLLSSLSIGTMSKTLFKKIIGRCMLDEKTTKKMVEYHSTQQLILQKALQSGTVSEYVYLSKDPFVSDAKIPLNIGDMFLNTPIYYTAEEYSEHLNDIVILLNENEGFHLVPLKENIFPNLQIIIKKNVGVIVMKNGISPVISNFGHPVICNAYLEYVRRIGEKSGVALNNKDALIEFLRYPISLPTK
jgi:predicted transcriptional regulator